MCRFATPLDTKMRPLASAPGICARLDAARRYHQLARFVPARAKASEWDDIAQDLASGALVALTPFRGGRG